MIDQASRVPNDAPVRAAMDDPYDRRAARPAAGRGTDSALRRCVGGLTTTHPLGPQVAADRPESAPSTIAEERRNGG